MKDSFQRVQQTAVPIIFQNTPHPFNGVVFAVLGGIVGQVHNELSFIGHLGYSFHKLSAPTVTFRAIILVDDQGFDQGETRLIH
jgi:hypothetical protein